MAIQISMPISSDEVFDFELDGEGNKKIVEQSQEVALYLKQRLQTYLGEWLFNTTVGVPYFQRILIRPFNKPLADSLIKREILKTQGVTGLISYSSNLNNRSRLLQIQFSYTDSFSNDINSLQIEVG